MTRVNTSLPVTNPLLPAGRFLRQFAKNSDNGGRIVAGDGGLAPRPSRLDQDGPAARRRLGLQFRGSNRAPSEV